MKKREKIVLELAFYLVVFVALQFFATMLIVGGYLVYQHLPYHDFQAVLLRVPMLTIVSTIVSSVLTIALFTWRKWAEVSRDYLKTRPWGTLIWVVVASLGIILPASGLEELFKVEMPESVQLLFMKMLHEPLGYMAVGIVVPIAEELVFRGAILNKLLQWFGGNKHWWAILISALVFGAVHANEAQFVHALLLGLLLGWLYYRSNSIIPGLVLHWVNNTVVYVVANLLPQFADVSLSELAQGKPLYIALYVLFSLCLFVPALFQLHLRLKKAA